MRLVPAVLAASIVAVVCAARVEAQDVEPGRPCLCQPLRRVPRDGRRWRRTRSLDCSPRSIADRPGSRSRDSRGVAGCWHAVVRESVEDREHGPYRVPQNAAPAHRNGLAAGERDARGWLVAVRPRPQSERRRDAAARRRSPYHLLRETTSGRYREVTSQTDWPTYNGQPSGNRYSTLTQITTPTSRGSRRSGSSRCPTLSQLQVTPVVVDGVMYVTCGERLLRARRRQRAPDLALPASAHAGLVGVAARGANRGVAVGGDRVFMIDRPRASHRAQSRHRRAPVGDGDGRLASELQRHRRAADRRQSVDPGIAGGDEGVRGFVAAYDQATGKEVWRFWTVPSARRAGIGNLEGQRPSIIPARPRG